MQILALLEANSISGTAKAVLEFAYEAAADRQIKIAVGNFARGSGIPDNALTNALSAAQVPLSFIREQGRFDRSVIPQIRDLIQSYGAQVIWTNSVKSHFLVYQAAIQKTCKWLAFHHGYTSTDLKMRLYNHLDRMSLRHADRVLTVCSPFAGQMKRRGVQAERIRVQHMPIRPFHIANDDKQALRLELGLPLNAKIILSIGRLSQEKGHKDLVESFAAFRGQSEELRLVMVGDGPERAKLEKMAGHDVLFVGHRDDAKRFYGIADVFALPSYTEGTPNVLLEAMAAGVPAIATNVGGVPELITDGQNGLLVPPNKPASLAEALQRLLRSDSLRSKLTQAANAVVSAHAPKLYFERMRQVFLEIGAE